MATQLTLSSTLYLNCVSLTSSTVANTAYTIAAADSTTDRRIYGLSISNTTSVNHLGCTLWLSDGTTNFQMGKLDVSANSGNSISVGAVDVFTNSIFSGLLTFAMADHMGVWYFNLPKTWSLKFTYTNTISAGQALTFTTFGEKYDGTTHEFTSNTFMQTATFSNANGTNARDLLSSAAYDRRIYAISAANTDVTARTMNLYLNDGTTSYLIYTESILANAGAATTVASIDLFYDSFIQGLFSRTADAQGVSYYFNLPAGWSLRGALTSAPAGSSQVILRVTGETYE